MAGIFFAIVGASGVGKDAILSSCQPIVEAIGNYHFPTRIITRPADAGHEEHHSISSAEFVQSVRDDRFCLWWMAHDLHYALPGEVDEKLRFDTHIIANISRRAVKDAVQKFNRVEVIEITANPDTIKNRLIMRGRETEAGIMARQLREIEPDWSCGLEVTKVENDSQLAEAVDRFISAVVRLSDQNAQQAQTA